MHIESSQKFIVQIKSYIFPNCSYFALDFLTGQLLIWQKLAKCFISAPTFNKERVACKRFTDVMDHQLNRFYIVVSWFSTSRWHKVRKMAAWEARNWKITAAKDKVCNFQSAVNGAVVDHVSVLCRGPKVEAVRRLSEILKVDFWGFLKTPNISIWLPFY